MNYYVLDEYKKSKDSKKLNKKKLIKFIIIVIVIIAAVVLFSLYIGNGEFRTFVDKNILQKEINEDTGPIIELTNENSNIFAYDKYITILHNNILSNYNSSGKKEAEIDVNISNPVYATNNRFLCLAEKGGNKLYLISGNNIIWQKDIEGEISKVNVNKNGYVSVIILGTTYKSIVTTYSDEGKDISTAFFSFTYAIDSEVSYDNKYLAIAEINSAGSLIQSNVKIISLEKEKKEVIYTYTADTKNIITNIKYQDTNKLICMLDSDIISIQNEQAQKIAELSEDVLFADINLSNYLLKVVKKSTGIFSSEYNFEIDNVINNSVSLYKIQGIPNKIVVYNDTIGINLGTEVHFIGTNGWLIKKYISSKDIKDIILCGNMAGIIYKDKIEILGL